MKVSFESIVFPCGLIKIALLCEISGKKIMWLELIMKISKLEKDN